MADPNTHRRDRTETREVRVDEPDLSPQTNQRLTDEVREVVGTDRVTVPADRPRASRGEHLAREHSRRLPWRPKSFLAAQIGAAGLVGGAVLALVTNSWWVLPAVVVLLGAVTYAVVALVMEMTGNVERPSPSTAAALDEEGVKDPEEMFSEVVAEFTEDTGERDERGRTTDVEDDPSRAAAEQESSITPSGGASRPAGPGAGGSRSRR
jgi:hypothetical protein